MTRRISVHIFYLFGSGPPNQCTFFRNTPILLLLVKLDKYGLSLDLPSEVLKKGTQWDFTRSQLQGFTCRTMHCWGSRLPTFRYKSDFFSAPPPISLPLATWLKCGLFIACSPFKPDKGNHKHPF